MSDVAPSVTSAFSQAVSLENSYHLRPAKLIRKVSINDACPVISITPATLPLTPPLTPIGPVKLADEQAGGDAEPPTTADQQQRQAAHAVPITCTAPASPTPVDGQIPADAPHSLQSPLRRHLTILHPLTPPDIVAFIATRLLSRDRPYGCTDAEGPWEPVWAGCGDIATAGVGTEAAKGCERIEGEGKERDERLERMYGIARRSYERLEQKCPGVDKL